MGKKGKGKKEEKTPIKKIQVEVASDFHKAVRIKALAEDTTISEVVRELLASWLSEGDWEEKAEGEDKW